MARAQSRLWVAFREALPESVLAVEGRPLPVLITVAAGFSVALALWLEPHCRQWSGLRAVWPVLLALGVGGSASLATYAALRRGRTDWAYGLQVVDFAAYAAVPVLGMVLCTPPAAYVFAAAYVMFVHHWGNVYGRSALLSGLIVGVPLGVSLFGLPDLGGVVVVAIVGSYYELVSRNAEHRRRLEARDRAHRDAVETVDEAVALAYEAARRDVAAEIGAAVHEIGNALVPGSVEVALLQERPGLEDAERESLDAIQGSIEEVTDRMRSLLRQVRGQLDEGPESFVLPEALEGLTRTRAGRLACDGRGLRVEPAPRVVLPGRAALLADVLANMVANAYEAGANTVTIRSTMAKGGARLLLEVEDDGPGVADEVRDRLFSPYVTQGKVHGVGLGLFVAAKVVQSLGGSLQLAASSSSGATFSLALPVLARATAEEGGPGR